MACTDFDCQYCIVMQDTEKKPRGGKREGSGRKQKTSKPFSFKFDTETTEILESYKGNQTSLVERSIKHYNKWLKVRIEEVDKAVEEYGL